MNILSFFWPQQIATFRSKFNPEIKVVEYMNKRYIDVGNLMQSGSFLETIYSKGLRKLKIQTPEKILILGLGGGSVVKVFNKFYPNAQITGVEIDKQMILAGSKYLDLKKAKNLKIIIGDAFQKIYKLKNKYDLIFVDMYQGYDLVKKINDQKFLHQLKKMKTEKGSVIFNLVYVQKYIPEANIFLDKLPKIFHYVNTAKIYANILVSAQ